MIGVTILERNVKPSLKDKLGFYKLFFVLIVLVIKPKNKRFEGMDLFAKSPIHDMFMEKDKIVYKP